jgi:hypothetical protein
MNDELVDIWYKGEKVISGITLEIADEVMNVGEGGVGWAIEHVGQCDNDRGLIAVPAGSPEPRPYDAEIHGVPHSRR